MTYQTVELFFGGCGVDSWRTQNLASMDADQLVEKADKAMSMIENSIPAWIDGSEMILGDAITTEEMQAEGQRIADEMTGLKV